jgi:hypothetical protein
MTETRTAAELEQYRVRMIALLVMLAGLIVAAVLVALGAYVPALATAGIAGAAWWWAARLYADLRDQAMQHRAMDNARGRFATPPPVDKFEA